MQVTSLAGAAGLIERLCASGVTLTYDPDTCSIRADDSDSIAVTVGRTADTTGTTPRERRQNNR